MKSPDERGHPASAWIVEARELLGLSDREVVSRLGRYDPATLRQAEAHSSRLSKPMWRALVPLYQAEAIAQGVTLRPPPRFHEPTPRGDDAASPDMAALLELVRIQTEELRNAWRAMADMAQAIRDAQAGAFTPAMAGQMRDELVEAMGGAFQQAVEGALRRAGTGAEDA